MPQLTLEYWEDDGWFVGRLVEIPGVFSQGETIEDLKENIQDAYKTMIENDPMESLPDSRNRLTLEVRPRSGGNLSANWLEMGVFSIVAAQDMISI